MRAFKQGREHERDKADIALFLQRDAVDAKSVGAFSGHILHVTVGTLGAPKIMDNEST